eukprot:3940668-Rhodomonas_salina.1
MPVLLPYACSVRLLYPRSVLKPAIRYPSTALRLPYAISVPCCACHTLLQYCTSPTTRCPPYAIAVLHCAYYARRPIPYLLSWSPFSAHDTSSTSTNSTQLVAAYAESVRDMA